MSGHLPPPYQQQQMTQGQWDAADASAVAVLAHGRFTCKAIPVMPAMCCAVMCCAVCAVCAGGQRGRAAAEPGAAVGLPGSGRGAPGSRDSGTHRWGRQAADSPPGLLVREGTRWLERPASWRGWSSSQGVICRSLTTAVQCHAVLCGAVLCCVVRAMLVPRRTAAEGK